MRKNVISVAIVDQNLQFSFSGPFVVIWKLALVVKMIIQIFIGSTIDPLSTRNSAWTHADRILHSWIVEICCTEPVDARVEHRRNSGAFAQQRCSAVVLLPLLAALFHQHRSL